MTPKVAQMVDFGGFLDLTRLADLVMGSNLVQTASSTSVGMLEAVRAAIAYNFTLISLLGCPENQDFDPEISIFAFQRPLEAPRGNIM